MNQRAPELVKREFGDLKVTKREFFGARVFLCQFAFFD